MSSERRSRTKQEAVMISGSKELVLVFRAARELMSRPGNDFTWSEWDGPEVAVAEIDSLISAVEAGDVPELDLSVLFAPTGPI